MPLVFVMRYKDENKKWIYGVSKNNYRVAILSRLYLTVPGIIIPGMKSIGQF